MRRADGTWLSAIREKVQSAAQVGASIEREKRWVTVAFTWNGLRALGVDEASLATFPEEFKQGMVARAEMLGDTGENHPDNWVGGLASPHLHAIVILFAGDEAERERCVTEHNKFIAQCSDVEVLSSLDLAAIPPFIYAHDHFGYRDRLSQPVIEGSGEGRPLAPARRSSRVNSSSVTRTKLGRPPICRSPKLSLATAATWPIVGCKSMSAGSGVPTPERWHSRGAGAFGSEAHGSLAEWRASRAVP